MFHFGFVKDTRATNFEIKEVVLIHRPHMTFPLMKKNYMCFLYLVVKQHNLVNQKKTNISIQNVSSQLKDPQRIKSRFHPAGIYLLKVNNGVVLVTFLLTLNIFHTLL